MLRITYPISVARAVIAGCLFGVVATSASADEPSADGPSANEPRADETSAARALSLPNPPYDYCRAPMPQYFADEARLHDNTPLDNPLTNAGATLGRVLFYDETLSVNRTISCASCHKQELAFADGRQVSIGFAGREVRRNSMSLINVRFYASGRFFWDERAATLEEQVLMPIEDEIEMGHSLPDLIRQLQSDPIYPPLFRRAFGDSHVNKDRIAKALAQFLRAIVSCRSKYDRGRAAVGSIEAPFPNFTPQENAGKDLFLDKGQCASCHLAPSRREGGPALQSALFVLRAAAVNGVDGKVEGSDAGVGGETHRPADLGAFKPPSLRNVVLTGPYMHDGRFSTLNRVVEHYNWGVRPHPNLDSRLTDPYGERPKLRERDKTALIAFLETLTDNELLRDPRFSDPFVRRSD